MTLKLPSGAVQYAQTKSFTEATIPKPLLCNHSTKPNSWGLIVLEAGKLLYTRDGQSPQTLEVGTNGVILPGELHKIAADGCVRFHIKFYHDPDTAVSSRDTKEIQI